MVWRIGAIWCQGVTVLPGLPLEWNHNPPVTLLGQVAWGSQNQQSKEHEAVNGVLLFVLNTVAPRCTALHRVAPRCTSAVKSSKVRGFGRTYLGAPKMAPTSSFSLPCRTLLWDHAHKCHSSPEKTEINALPFFPLCSQLAAARVVALKVPPALHFQERKRVVSEVFLVMESGPVTLPSWLPSWNRRAGA